MNLPEGSDGPTSSSSGFGTTLMLLLAGRPLALLELLSESLILSLSGTAFCYIANARWRMRWWLIEYELLYLSVITGSGCSLTDCLALLCSRELGIGLGLGAILSVIGLCGDGCVW